MSECWTWNVDPVVWNGPITIRWYSLCFMVVFAAGWYLQRWQITRSGRKHELATEFVIWAVLAVLIGGWLGHQLFYNFDKLTTNPGALFKFSGGIRGLSSHGSTVGLVVALVLFARRNGIPVLEHIDRFTWSATAGAIGVRVGNLFNSEIIGRPTDLSWAVCYLRRDSVPRHPSQLYEVGMGLLVMATLFLVDRMAGKEKRPLGLITGTFFVTYFAGRFVVEFFKAHQTLSQSNPLTMGQYLSIPFVICGVILIVQAWRRPQVTEELVKQTLPAAETSSKKKKKKGRKKK